MASVQKVILQKDKIKSNNASSMQATGSYYGICNNHSNMGPVLSMSNRRPKFSHSWYTDCITNALVLTQSSLLPLNLVSHYSHQFNNTGDV